MLNDYSNAMRKKAIKSVLDILILQLIKNNVMYGSRILKEIKTRFDVLLSDATIYSALSLFQDQGFITSSHDKILILTKKGETLRKELIKDYLRLQEQLNLIFKDDN